MTNLRQLVFEAMGVSDFETHLDEATHPKIWHFLNSGAHVRDTPEWRMKHNRLKMPEEHVDEWIDPTELEKLVQKIPEITAHLRRTPSDRKKIGKLVEKAVFWHKVKSPFYWAKSTTSDPAYHHLIASAAEGMPLEMNRHNAREGAKHLLELLQRRRDDVTVMDVGVGGGNTTRFLLEELRKLDSRALKQVKLVLNDVEPSLPTVAELLSREFGIAQNRITTLPFTFYAVSHGLGLKMPKPPWKMHRLEHGEAAKSVANLEGKIDLLVSGASFNNLPHSRLAFSTVRALLSRRGKAMIWDWGGYDLTQQSFKQSELNRTIQTTEGTRITVRDNVKGFWRFWLWHHGYIDPMKRDSKWWEKLEAYIDTAKQVNVNKWFDRNVKQMEKHRVARKRPFTYFGHANRAYRTPEDVLAISRKVGLRPVRVHYPMAGRTSTENGQLQWREPNPRFVTWRAELQKAA